MKNEAVNVLGTNFDVFIPKLRQPKVVIRGAAKEYDYEEFVAEILQTNPGFDDSDVIKVVHHKRMKNDNTSKWMYFLEVRGRTLSKIVDKHLNIDFKSQIVREYVDVLRCYKCQKYGHKSASCNSQIVCGKCGGRHEFNDCKESVVQCINCKEANEKNKTKCDTSHVCGSSVCSYQAEMIEKQKDKINYNNQHD